MQLSKFKNKQHSVELEDLQIKTSYKNRNISSLTARDIESITW